MIYKWFGKEFWNLLFDIENLSWKCIFIPTESKKKKKYRILEDLWLKPKITNFSFYYFIILVFIILLRKKRGGWGKYDFPPYQIRLRNVLNNF